MEAINLWRHHLKLVNPVGNLNKTRLIWIAVPLLLNSIGADRKRRIANQPCFQKRMSLVKFFSVEVQRCITKLPSIVQKIKVQRKRILLVGHHRKFGQVLRIIKRTKNWENFSNGNTIQASLAFMSRGVLKTPEGILASRILTRKNDTSVEA